MSLNSSVLLQTDTVRATICYTALVCFICQLQRFACLFVTVIMRKTLTAALEVILCLPPLDIFVLEALTQSSMVQLVWTIGHNENEGYSKVDSLECQ